MMNKCNLLNDLSCGIKVYNLVLRCPHLIIEEDLSSSDNTGATRDWFNLKRASLLDPGCQNEQTLS